MAFFDRMKAWLKGKPKPPKVNRIPVPFGHTGGGVAGHLFGGDLASNFVYGGQPIYVQSSNVDTVQYNIEDNTLLVGFIGDGIYRYSNISEQEAVSLAQARSKGRWCWTNLRIRGTKTGHRKPYVKIS